MKKFILFISLLSVCKLLAADEFQVTNPDFEDWSAPAFNSNPQAVGWNASNVEQVGMKFNFAHKESGRNGGSCMMVQDQSVGAMGITETSPGYVSIGQPWAYLPSITQINQATAGTYGGQKWTHRPDSMSVWIKRTGSNTDKEDFYLLYYAWVKEAKGTSYKGKNGNCTSVSYTNEESDVRIAMNGNECKTTVPGEQVCEGMWRERKSYGQWTNIRVPIYYFNDEVPKFMNIIFSASNYPNFRANNGLYEGNSLYVDDVELIYSSKIQKLYVDDKEWKGFDPNSTAVQNYALGENATAVPMIVAMRGAGSLTNAKGTTKSFPGRRLSGDEISIVYGDLDKTPTVITVKSEDGKSTTVYRIQFQRAASSNAKLASISVNGTPIAGFSPTKYNYSVELPYGTTTPPVVSAEGQEEKQTLDITQPGATEGTASIVVTAANGIAKATYTLTFKVGLLSDNTLKDILINGSSLPGFTPSQVIYKVSLPTTTTTMPTVTPVSAYQEGEQTIVHTVPNTIDGGTYSLSVTTPGNVVPKVYKLNFKLEASSYSYLGDLKVGGVSVADFSPENYTYYVNMPMGTSSLPKVEGVSGESSQTIAVTDLGEGVVDGTVRVTVTAGNKSDQTVYKVVFTTAKSEVSVLSGIKIGGEMLADFEPEKLSYAYTLPVGTTELPVIEPIAFDEFQDVVLTSAGVNGKTRITVTAGNGSTTVYQIAFSVATYTDNTLAGIFLDGVLIDGFEPEVNDYTVVLPKGSTALPEVTFTKRSEQFQDVNIRPLTGSLNGDYKLTVRPQSGASRTYVIHFVTNKSTNSSLSAIYLDGTPLPGFEADKYSYEYTLPEGVSVIPEVTFVKGDEGQRVLSVLENKEHSITVTAESGARSVYTIKFIVQVSENASLNMIYIDGVELEGFQGDLLSYTYPLTTAVCPAITVDKAPGQQVTITAPYAAGRAFVQVKPEQGSINTYTIDFVAAATATVQLGGILVDGVPMTDFQPQKMDYSASYSGSLPEVSYIKGDEKQEVTLLWNNATALLYVKDAEGNKATYSIGFVKILSDSKLLNTILVDGNPLPAFVPETKDYVVDLAAGSSYPEVGYVAAEDAQVVFFGLMEEGKWGITVAAEDGSMETYSVQFKIALYEDSRLADLAVEGYTLPFAPDKYDYNLSIDEGAALPVLSATPMEGRGQQVLVYNLGENDQEVLVTAQDGIHSSHYTVHYTREKSHNALLEKIYVDGVELPSFRPDVFHYVLPLGAEAKVVPNIFPIGQLDNQTITTTFGKPDESTTIVVLAQDGVTSESYTIDFEVAVSANTKLKSLTIDGYSQDVNKSEFVFEVPFGTVQPYSVAYEKAEQRQLIEYLAAPVTEPSYIIVTAENGDKRTYTIRYNVVIPKGENKVAKIGYSYQTADGVTHQGELVPAVGDNKIELPYGTKSFDVTEVTKNYDKQSLVFYNGGIRRGATIIVSANREGEADVVYTVTPVLPAYEKTGKLEDLRFKGVTVPNFRPDVYNYMVNVTAQPTAADFAGTAFEGKAVAKSSINAQKKQITLTVAGGETYSVCWYYTNYENIFDFSADWIKADKGNGYKPSSLWKVPADYSAGYDWGVFGINFTYSTGKEVVPYGAKGATLSTLRGASMNGSVPGMMTLGAMSLNLTSNGNSTSSVTKNATTGAAFKNTPEALAFSAKPLSSSNITNWKMWFTISDGSTYRESNYSGDFSSLNTWKEISIPFNYTGLGAVSRFNIMLSSCDQENAKQFGGSTIYESSVIYDNIRFVYNSELTAVSVDGIAATKSGNTFTATVGNDYVGVPRLKFSGAVHDQMQVVEWLNDGEWVNGELRAKVTNYGENSSDHTDYTVVVRRAAVTSLDYTPSFGALTTTMHGDTTIVHLPFGVKALPDFRITPASVHQSIVVTKAGNMVKVLVRAENGSTKEDIYLFREKKSGNAALESISAEDLSGKTLALTPAFLPEMENYTVEAEQMPVLSFQKAGEADGTPEGQRIHVVYTKTSATIEVTAEDGKTVKTYTINLSVPAYESSGLIAEFSQNDIPWDYLGATTYVATKERPVTPVFFTRQDDKDAVVNIQTPEYMEWQVSGTESHTYRLTYPTSLSANTRLEDIQIDGQSLTDFQPDDNSQPYVLTADTTVVIRAVLAEAEQQLAVTSAVTDGGMEYRYTVTAEDGVSSRVYTLRLLRPLSTDATLAGILLDGSPLAGFAPDVMDYSVVLPAPQGAKTEQPKMPSVTYLAGDPKQTIAIEPGVLNGDETVIKVSDPAHTDYKEYTIAVTAAPSHCTELTGIVVNGEAIAQFESGRHYYSHSLKNNSVEIGWTTDDRFQKVTVSSVEVIPEQEYTYTLHVEAEDGSVAKYQVEIYIDNLSNDARLANILINRQELTDFLPELNPDIKPFEPGNNTYDINLPSGTTVLPDISARLKREGQSVDIRQYADSVLLTVTASDGTENVYRLYFHVPYSANADLSMIFLDGDSLKGFSPAEKVYRITLPVGVYTLPAVVARKGESSQTVQPIEVDEEAGKVTVSVTAEDGKTKSTYIIFFAFTLSDADTLAMVYEDGAPMAGFDPENYYYSRSLPVGTTVFPELSWDEADAYQTISMATVESTPTSLTRQITVVSESGKKSIYTIVYTILKSDVDTLQMIIIDRKLLPDFRPMTAEYHYTLSADYAASLNGEMPVVEWIPGDEYQTVMVSQMRDTLIGKSLEYKTVLTVTAATGKTRTYVIHYPVELSSVATLNMINLASKPLTNYDAERFNYKVEIEQEASLPLVSVIKKEEAQTYEIQVLEDSVYITVTAEDGVTRNVYTLVFERRLSANTSLRNILLYDADGAPLPASVLPFRPEEYGYTVDIDYDPSQPALEQLPAMETVLADSRQTIETEQYVLPTGDIRVDITVIAPNAEDRAVYTIVFHFRKPSDATLVAIMVGGDALADFDPTTTEYSYLHPYGTEEDAMFDVTDVSYVLSDSLAQATVTMDENGTIYITVIAQDGESENTYIITQSVAADGDNTLAWIKVDGELLRGFDPEQTFYTYYIMEGNTAPAITAEARSENAELSLREAAAGDTCLIICTAADGSERRYYVHFAFSSLNPGLVPTSNDVLIKRIPGTMQYMAATLRSGVTFALYDRRGQLVHYSRVPVADPNDAEVFTDADRRERLNDVIDTRSGLLVEVIPGEPYFYVFFADEKKKLSSGKIMAY